MRPAGQVPGAFGEIFMVMDDVMHMMKPAQVLQAFGHMGYDIGR